ncbi:hypothetical protein [Providencia rustigianii]|uniref:hypothetical protein n=1 Tax=Providencia rustigianii TaxID=158850 RepID=UPI0022434D02|nr:hypothetical protein [Providencia rustigianii]
MVFFAFFAAICSATCLPLGLPTTRITTDTELSSGMTLAAAICWILVLFTIFHIGIDFIPSSLSLVEKSR